MGGAVVAIYSNEAYTSGDLDLVVINKFKIEIDEIMAEIGFTRRPERRYFSHPKCSRYFIEFPPGPVEIADNTKIKPIERNKDGETIKILSPTDCIIDRLASYIYWGENHEDLENAVLVGKTQRFSSVKIKKFCEKLTREDVYRKFISLIKLP